MSDCPKCLRPFNDGNSPNAEECNETDDDDGICEAYAKVAALRADAARLTAERDLWREKVVNHAYEVTVTCYAGHSYQQEFGTCPSCRAEVEAERDALAARLREAVGVADKVEWEGGT